MKESPTLCLVACFLAFTERSQAEPKNDSAAETLVSAGLYSRSLEYGDDRFSTLYAHRIDKSFALRMATRLYPGVLLTKGPLRHIGAEATYEFDSGTPHTRRNHSLSTSAGGMTLGLRGRLPLNMHEFALSLAYGGHYFGMDRDGEGRVPDVDYKFVRLGLGAKFRFDRFAIELGFGYRILTGLGEIGRATWFPSATGLGNDISISVGYSLSPSLDLAFGFDYRRYVLNLSPEPDNSRALANQVAGSAVDAYPMGWLGIAWHLVGGSL